MRKVFALILLMLITQHTYGASDYRTWGNLENGGIESTTAYPKKFASITQSIRIHPASRGQEIKFSISVEATNVIGWAGLWMRLENAQGEILNFDNMDNRPITGSTDWIRYSNQLYVPQDATDLVYGVLLDGAGKIRVSAFELE